MENKNFIIVALCVAIGIMSVAYAAFSTTLNISATSSQSGTFGVLLMSEELEVTGTPGLTGATAPTAQCGPAANATGDMTATFYQPGDTVTCKYKVNNSGNLKAKASGNYSCTAGSGMAASQDTSSSSKPLWYSVTWRKSLLAGGATSDAGEITITMTYSASITADPGTKTGKVSCTFPYTQDI